MRRYHFAQLRVSDNQIRIDHFDTANELAELCLVDVPLLSSPILLSS